MKKSKRMRMIHLGSNHQYGFSVVELIAVVMIVGILAAAVLPMTKVSVIRANELELKRELRTLRRAIDTYKKMADENQIEVEESASGYPEDLEVLVEGIELKDNNRTVRLLRKIPRDPFTGRREWGLRGSDQESDEFSWDGEDVFDVYSLSDRRGLDGTLYREW